MTLDTFETVLVACILILPGFITDGIVNQLVSVSRRNQLTHML